MRIKEINIENFRGINKVNLTNLEDLVVIAGPNGSGKSSIFDAIRILKSVYGGYQDNEVDQWINEFQLTFSPTGNKVGNIFRNEHRSIVIEATFLLDKDEKAFLNQNGEKLLKSRIHQYINPNIVNRSLANEISEVRTKINEQLPTEMEQLLTSLNEEMCKGQLIIKPEPNFSLEITPNKALEIVFSNYVPDEIGIIDYHGPHRNYNRERIGGVNLSIDGEEQRMSQSALYNYVNKYSNVKAEMAGAYVRELIAEKAGRELTKNTIQETLGDLFKTFFPGKEFLGPQPDVDGNLKFPVKLVTGETHDIDELSSGEKEIIYGYLRLRNHTPHNSVLLLDEPELHLNPRLIRGLPQFYNKYLGKDFNNQIWLITHSDAFLREALNEKGCSVFHMQPPETATSNNQAYRLDTSTNLERAVMDLVGDLSTYRPESKVVVFEGGGDSEFDISMTSTLFPEFANLVNPVSGTSKIRVRELHNILAKLQQIGIIPIKIFSITDQDTTKEETSSSSTTAFQWDVYHIENYLLVEEFILEVIKEINIKDAGNWDTIRIGRELKECARLIQGKMVKDILISNINKDLVKNINIGCDPQTNNISEDLHKSVVTSLTKMNATVGNLTLEKMKHEELTIRAMYESDLNTGRWVKTFKGRDILNLFVGRNANGLNYKYFRDLIISKMTKAGYKPEGMSAIIEKIIKTE